MFKELLDLLYPPACLCCQSVLSDQKDLICIGCRSDLHRTNYHLLSSNPVEQHFMGRLKIEKATSFLHFKAHSKTQIIMHSIKYEGNRDLGILMGMLCARDLMKDGFFTDIDLLVPVPLHASKEKKRGYNQAALIAAGISKVSQVQFSEDLVLKNENTESQTKKGRSDRFENVSNSFSVINNAKTSAEHLLLIDDVITTGSTLEACGLALQSSMNCRLSILSLAATD